MSGIATLDPVPALLRRLRAELSDSFRADHPLRVSRAPGRLDVMGGIADYTGSLVCEATLDRAAAVALQERPDRGVQVFSFNLLDDHQPFTLRIPLDALANNSADSLRREFAQPGRQWAGYLAGCLHMLHDSDLVDLRDPKHRGLNLALYSTVPIGAGVSSSAAIEIATMMNLADHFAVRDRLDPMRLAAMCQAVENRIVGAPCGIMDQVTSCAGQAGTILRLLCQPHELQPPLALPAGVRVLGINSNVKHAIGGARGGSGGGPYARTRCAAFMGHRIILEKMREFGRAANRPLERDPMNGYLANLDPEDYKKYFRPYLPDSIKGGEFLLRYGPTIDSATTTVVPDVHYAVRNATDHHVLEAMRVRNFVRFIEQAAAMSPDDPARRGVLDKAGHLMYASHFAYTHDAHLGAPECDLLVQLVRDREPAGLYGAKITGGGSGGTVAILADRSPSADAAIPEIIELYQRETGKKAELLAGTSAGAWEVGTEVVTT
jgi:galactokinase